MASSRGIEIKERRVSITDANVWKALPKHNIAETPGGTMWGTTPGGTRIIYDRLFMLAQKNSPCARTPPKLPKIPGVTVSLAESSLASGDTMKPIREETSQEKETTSPPTDAANQSSNEPITADSNDVQEDPDNDSGDGMEF